MEIQDWPKLVQRHPTVLLLGYFPPFWAAGYLWLVAFVATSMFKEDGGWLDMRGMAPVMLLPGLVWPTCAYNGRERQH